MLGAWCGHLQQTGQAAPDSLRFVAVGGAAVGAPLILAARARGIPAYEGYGLSEGASVQTLNLPGADRPGSAGRVLPHARLRVSDAGELLIGGSLFSGYLGDGSPVRCASIGASRTTYIGNWTLPFKKTSADCERAMPTRTSASCAALLLRC